MKHIYIKLMNSFFDSEGIANRKELMIFVFFNIIIIPLFTLLILALLFFIFKNIFNTKVYEIITGILGLGFAFGIVYLLIGFFVLLIRRLHDTGRSGYHLLFTFLPAGIIFVLIWLCLPGKDKNNKYKTQLLD